jgi:ParB family chromosome partitioning protein
MTTAITEISLSKLVPSEANVRRTGRDANIEELAASIAAHGLLQNLSVRAVLKADGTETGKFEVVAGGRRHAALKLLAKRKSLSKNVPIPCRLLEEGVAEEISLAENATQCPMHPADQYEAFANLAREHGMAAEDIAARFGVTASVVKQRMKLGAVAPALMQVYREDGMTLDQLMGFTITDDHARQERVWSELGWNKSREIIRRLLTEGLVPAQDRRAKFVGAEAYEAAGGVIIRDLFDEEGGGYFADAALLDRLVAEKLTVEAVTLGTEGWKWVEVTPEFDYRMAAGLRRTYPKPVPLTEAEQTTLDALEASLEALSVQHDGEISDEIAAEFDRLEAEIEALKGREHYEPDIMARSGAFVSLGFDGVIRIERGFVRAEDEIARPSEDEPEAGESPESLSPGDDTASEREPEDQDGGAALSDRLLAELSAYRTAGLRDALAERPDMALIAVVHALAARSFYHGHERGSCLDIEIKSTALAPHAPGIDESPALRRITERHEAWAKRMPTDLRDLWTFVGALDDAERLALLAHCAALTVDVLAVKWNRRPHAEAHANALAQDLTLDMTSSWTPTAASYFGRVSKARILEAVREGVSDEAAERIAPMKKQPMAEAAEQLLTGTGWLPTLLRTPSPSGEASGARTQTLPVAAE